ncbi:MAG TPA: TlpA disulfide reductase family protein [Segetibacter sp.]|jgi:peroxiredoxin
MKNVLTLSFSLFLINSFAQEQAKFLVTGNVSSVKDKIQKIYFSYTVDGRKVEDSAEIKKNKYVLAGKISETGMLFVKAKYVDTSIKYDYRRDYKTLYISPGDKAVMTHKDSFSVATVKGSLAQTEFLTLDARAGVYLKQLSNHWKEIDAFKAKGDTAAVKQTMATIKAVAEEWKGVYTSYVYKNPSSPMALYAIKQYSGPFIAPVTIEPLYNVLSEKNKNTLAGKDLYRKLDIAKRTAIGKDAPIITQKDTLGNTISLADYKGKYVLLEFWASWCKPCREENPNLLKTYAKYQQKGFEVLGVSVDESRKSWINAINKDGLTWKNTGDLLSSEKNPAALAYGVTAIPNNYLIDPTGKIIASNLRGEALEKKLAELIASN